MNIKRILLSATASLLIASSLVGCARVGDTPYVGDGNEAVEVTPLAYKYGETEKAQLAADGLFCDFENESVGIKYEADATSTVTGGIFSYRPKLSVFEIVSSEDGHALRYERSAQSAAQNTDPHFDVELGGNIPARVDFVAEYDIMPLSDGIKCNLLQTIYRPTSGRIMGAYVVLDGTELKWNGTAIAEISKGEYTKVACVMHQSNGTLDIYVNGYMVQYGLSYIKTADTGHEPNQVRVINSNSGECSAIIDNVAVYRGSEPKYISRVSEDDIKTVHKYGFEGAEGAYAGEDGLTVGSGNSTYNIIKTPDGRSVLRDSVVSAGNMSISTAGCERIRAFSVEFYLTSEESDYTLVAFRGDSWTNVLEIRGNMLWSSIDDKPVREIETHRWTRADVFIDGIKNTCAIYVDGYRYVDGVSVPADALEKMDSIRIGATSTPEKSYSVYLDNIHLYNATGVLGYKGAASGGAETVYTVVDPDSYQYAGSTVAGELIVT
ncbi:MAG: hypothetical protein IJY04_01725, partial [Clostridia bacterium]|nr:hypothetical protein [Clostridia bacterium]